MASAQMTNQEKNLHKKIMFKWLMSFLLSTAILIIPTGESFSFKMKVFFAITVFAICLLAFELVGNFVVSATLVLGYIIFRLAPLTVIFEPWTTQIAWLLISSMIFTQIMNKIGLSKRIGLYFFSKIGDSFVGIIIAMTIAGIILAFCVPGSLARLLILWMIVSGALSILGYDAKSKQASGISIGIYLASHIPVTFIMSAGTGYYVLLNVLNSMEQDVSWGQLFVQNFIPGATFSVVCLALLVVMFRPKEKPKEEDAKKVKRHFQEQYVALGKMSTAEKKLLAITLVGIVLLITTSIHKLPAGFVFLAMVTVCFLPGFNLATDDDVRKINFSTIFLVTSMLAVGNVSVTLGAGDLIVGLFQSSMPENTTLLTMFLMVIVMLGNLILTPLALLAGISGPILQMGQLAGIDPIGLSYIFYMSLDCIFLPYEATGILLLYGFGYLNLKDFIGYSLIKSLLFFILLAVFLIPYYKLIGIF